MVGCPEETSLVNSLPASGIAPRPKGAVRSASKCCFKSHSPHWLSTLEEFTRDPCCKADAPSSPKLNELSKPGLELERLRDPGAGTAGAGVAVGSAPGWGRSPFQLLICAHNSAAHLAGALRKLLCGACLFIQQTG